MCDVGVGQRCAGTAMGLGPLGGLCVSPRGSKASGLRKRAAMLSARHLPGSSARARRIKARLMRARLEICAQRQLHGQYTATATGPRPAMRVHLQRPRAFPLALAPLVATGQVVARARIALSPTSPRAPRALLRWPTRSANKGPAARYLLNP